MNIWNSLIGYGASALQLIVSLFPLADTNATNYISTAISSFKTQAVNASFIFPVWDFFNMLGIILIIEASIFGYKILTFIIKNISLGFFKD